MLNGGNQYAFDSVMDKLSNISQRSRCLFTKINSTLAIICEELEAEFRKLGDEVRTKNEAG